MNVLSVMRKSTNPSVWPMVCCCLLVSFFSPLYSDVAAPETFVKSGIDSIIEVIVNEKDRGERYRKVKKIFLKSFDLPRLAGMTLGGSSWRELKMEQKVAFTDKYSEFVLSFYLDKLEGYDGNKIEVGEPEFKSNGKKAIVPTLIEFQGKQAQLKYSMILGEKSWKIYDVEVEGVRLSSTYRNQFQDVLKKSQFEGLIAELDRLISQARVE
jgi:phospholipid transport system substrate-binding protein